jgi:hypothetical protein
MEKKEISIYISNQKNDDYIEPEIVSESYGSSKSKKEFSFVDFLRFKIGKFFLIITLPIALIFLVIGIFLSSTLVGAIFGIPLVILGIIVFVASIFVMRFIIPK